MLQYLIPIFDTSVSSWSAEARWLRWLTFLWLFIGLLVLFSASFPIAHAEYGDGFYYIKRQLIWVAAGLIGFNFLVHFPIRSVVRLNHWLLLLFLALIWLTLVPGLGNTVNGATRWISIFGVPVQPSELIKPFLVVQAARVFAKWHALSLPTRWFWLVLFASVLVGILLQPNLSTTALCGMTIWLVALASGLRMKYLATTAIAGLGMAAISISINAYQQRRIMSFLDPWSDPQGSGYQLIQSLLAVGSGGILGSGFGMSQQKLFYLPIQYSDFIFSVYAEEFGLVGSWLLLFLLMAYATVGLRVALKARSLVYQLMAMGLTSILIVQAFINIGVATGFLPTTGLPFPMFSYGGSSMISSLLVAGFLVRVARESRHAKVVGFDRFQQKQRSPQPSPKSFHPQNSPYR
ncbi:putative peptidoglycan glycosyltransferase FtsW [Geitlerinema sp. PCC 9228]|jgi:cell division protein FtsW|uniref:FtsW/RodA/SpoVE family cell cycle protein n=1 Tax=Geitlerinema sp. PCC 9228 TaxID=111611 RepID=UPI0008F9DFDD|nr:putative peptidoglycan glycosyltransferase FtsW [Geitlerinema sp. PCC 9228]